MSCRAYRLRRCLGLCPRVLPSPLLSLSPPDLALLVMQWEMGAAAAAARAQAGGGATNSGALSPTAALEGGPNPTSTPVPLTPLVGTRSPELGPAGLSVPGTPVVAGVDAGASSASAAAVVAPPSLDVVANLMVRHALITAETPELTALSRRSVRVVEDVIKLRPNAVLRFAYFGKLSFGSTNRGGGCAALCCRFGFCVFTAVLLEEGGSPPSTIEACRHSAFVVSSSRLLACLLRFDIVLGMW